MRCCITRRAPRRGFSRPERRSELAKITGRIPFVDTYPHQPGGSHVHLAIEAGQRECALEGRSEGDVEMEFAQVTARTPQSLG